MELLKATDLKRLVRIIANQSVTGLSAWIDGKSLLRPVFDCIDDRRYRKSAKSGWPKGHVAK